MRHAPDPRWDAGPEQRRRSVVTVNQHEAAPGRVGTPSRLAGWIRKKDPGLLTIKRSIRSAVVMPFVFGLAQVLTTNDQVAIFGAFGSFALMQMVDFSGPPRTRATSYGGLFVVGACFIALGTVVSTDKIAAVVAMAVVGFGVLFFGIASPQAALATTSALLLFVLPVAVAQPAGQVGPRLVGWLMAGLFCIPACLFVWPTPWHDDLRRRLSATLVAVSQLARAHAGESGDASMLADMQAELSKLRSQFEGTTYGPTATAADTVALAKLAGRVEWVAGNGSLVSDAIGPLNRVADHEVMAAVAETLQRSAVLICDGHGHPVSDPVLVSALEESVQRLERLTESGLRTEVTWLIDTARHSPAGAAGGGLASSLDPSFPVRALSVATEMVADAALEAAGAQGIRDRRLGPIRERIVRPVWSRMRSHISARSVWFRNAVRGAVGLSLAVAVVEITDVEHGFWVVLGTLSVLRTNALGTGATALRAVGGTAAGFVVGSAIMLGVANHTVLLWALLPVAVLVAGVAPSMISFAAGQAAFTVVVVVLFNIIAPLGWRVGLTRVEDVAIGCAVSVGVGLLFWPRGATAALGRALSNAFVASSAYLSDAVALVSTTTHLVDTQPSQQASHRAYLLLDDAFHQFVAERGAKVVPVETVARLVTGSNRLRLGAYTLSTLSTPTSETGPSDLDTVAVAGAVLRDSYASSHRWYEEFAEVLSDRRRTLDPPPTDEETLHHVLRDAFEDARSHGDIDRLRMTLHMLWADELLEAQRQVQSDLAASAELFARSHSKVMI